MSAQRGRYYLTKSLAYPIGEKGSQHPVVLFYVPKHACNSFFVLGFKFLLKSLGTTLETS
jgi:hypothetical protein